MNIPLPSRHERRRVQTRNRLIQATRDLLVEKGFDAISIRDITDSADLGRGTFYIHFKDKEDAIWMVFQEMIQEFEREMHEKLDRNMPQVEYYGLLNIYRHAEKNRDVYRIMLGTRGSALLTGRVQDFIANLFLFDIRNASAASKVNFRIPDEIKAQLITGLISRLLFWWLETSSPYSSVQMATFTYEVVYRKKPPEGEK